MLAKLFNHQEKFLLSRRLFENLNLKTMKYVKLLLLFMLATLFQESQVFAQTASVAVNPSVICDGQQAQIVGSITGLPSGVTISSYQFFIDGNSVGVKPSSAANETFATLPLACGNYKAKVTVTLSNSNTVTSSEFTFSVYCLPVASVTNAGNPAGCIKTNNLCYINNSVPGASPSNAIESYYWNWGDATGDSAFNNSVTCHKYNSPGSYTVFVRVTDTKGCYKDITLVDAYKVEQSNIIDFDWTMLSGPCFNSCYRFINQSTKPRSRIKQYTWDFGDGSTFSSSTTIDSLHYDTITHCYSILGPFTPKLTTIDDNDCLDSLRKTSANSNGKTMPDNIVFDLDIQTYKPSFNDDGSFAGVGDINADTICAASFSNTMVCFKITPLPFLHFPPNSGAFKWDFGDPKDPTFRNIDSSDFTVCHAFSGMGTFFPKLQIIKVCPMDIPFYTAVAVDDRFDSILFPVPKVQGYPLDTTNPTAFDDNDWGLNPYGIPATQVIYPDRVRQLLDFIAWTDSIKLSRSPGHEQYLAIVGAQLVLYSRYLYEGMPTYIGNTTQADTIGLKRSEFVKLVRLTGNGSSRILKHNGDTMYAFKGRYSRPIVWIKRSPHILKDDGVSLADSIMWHVGTNLELEELNGYGVEIVGPFARIENPPVPVVLKPWQKNQCGPNYTVDFVNTSVYFKSNKIWRRWEFGDDYAPRCTSFSIPKPSYFAVGQPRTFVDAVEQERNSYHYFIHDGKTYKGKVNCNYSHDTLPRHTYTNWDSVYNWYLVGKDWTAEASVGPKYWDPYNNRISDTPGVWYGSGYDSLGVLETITQPWAQIDTNMMTKPRDFWPTRIQQDRPIDIDRLPDPFAHLRGDYVILTGGQLRAFPPANKVVYTKDGKTYTLNSGDMIPGGGMTFHKYTFTRMVQKCITVTLKLADTLNHEAGNPYTAVGYDSLWNLVDDSMSIDNFDCWGEGNVTLALGKATAYGLAKGGKECPGDLNSGLGARIDLSLAGIGSYPGVTPNCGQTHILFNIDSLADRMDQTPCDLDGWFGYQGGQTPGGLQRPTLNNCPNANPMPGCPWTNPRGTRIVWHFGFNAGPSSAFNFPPPADTAGGWITIGLQIGCGCKDTTVTVQYNNFMANPTAYMQNIFQVSNKPYVVGMPNNTPPVNGFIQYKYVYGDTVRNPNNPALLDIKYFDCDYANAATNTVWYHNFIRIMNLDAQFDVFPAAVDLTPRYSTNSPVRQNGICRLRGKGDEITVLYLDSVMDSVYYSAWDWGDGTVTIDSFWYAPNNEDITDNFYEHGVRRVRYNFDCFSDCVLLDSTVNPVRSSSVGAMDGLKPRVLLDTIWDPYLYRVFDVLERRTDSMQVRHKCTGDTTLMSYKDTMQWYNVQQVVDTALMFTPVTHKFVRSSWEASGSNETSEWGNIVHLLVTRQLCQQFYAIPVVIGVIDTFFIRDVTGKEDTVFCENEEIFFDDSVRYWRYDCAKSDCNFPPGPGRSIGRDVLDNVLATGDSTGFGYDPNAVKYVLVMGGVGCNFIHDTADFWRYEAGKLPEEKGVWLNDMYRYDRNADTVTLPYTYARGTAGPFIPPNDHYAITHRVDTVRRERMYWDFGDGSPIYEGVSPSHQYATYGRYAVTMYTRDSLSFWDTCVRWVNIVKPVAHMQLAKNIFNCSELFATYDSSYVEGGLDQIVHNFWWSGANKVDSITPTGKDVFPPRIAQWPYRYYGEFKVKLKVQTEQGCTDSTYETIYVKGPRPRIQLLSDTLGCAPMRVRVWNLADSIGMQAPGDTPTVETLIYWGEPNASVPYVSVLGRRDTVEHIYYDSGTYSIVAVGRDAVFPSPTTCLPAIFPDTTTDPFTGTPYEFPINIYVKKFNNRLNPHDTIICVDNEVEFENTSDDAFTKFTYERYDSTDMSLIDSIVHNQPPIDKVKFMFNEVGNFQIHSVPRGFDPTQIPVGSEANCIIRDTSYVMVVEPRPAFDTVRADLNSAKFQMVNTTNIPVLNSDAFEWTIYKMDGSLYVPGDGVIQGGLNPKLGNLSDKDFEVDFKNDTGDYKVCLKAWHIKPPANCADTVCKILKNSFITNIKVPNVFSPNGDGTNDNFVIEIEGETKYELTIWNRWGTKVFTSEDKNNTWNGKDMNEGAECPAGVYYFIFNYQMRAQDPATITGTITLIR